MQIAIRVLVFGKFIVVVVVVVLMSLVISYLRAVFLKPLCYLIESNREYTFINIYIYIQKYFRFVSTDTIKWTFLPKKSALYSPDLTWTRMVRLRRTTSMPGQTN